MSRVQTPFEYRADQVQRALERLRRCQEEERDAREALELASSATAEAHANLENERAALFEEYPELLPAQTPTPAGSSSDGWQPPGGALDFGEQDDTPPERLEFTESPG